MTTIELNAALQREIRAIGNDEDLLRQAISAIKALRKGKNATHPEPPCCYTVEEVKKRLSQTLDDALHGRGISEEEANARIARMI